MKQKIYLAIEGGHVKEYIALVRSFPIDQQAEILYTLAIETESIAVYTAVCFLILQEECAMYHYLAAKIFESSLASYTASIGAALWHAKRAQQLEPLKEQYIVLVDRLAHKIQEIRAHETHQIHQVKLHDTPEAEKTLYIKCMLYLQEGYLEEAIELIATLQKYSQRDYYFGIAYDFICPAIYTLSWFNIFKQETIESQTTAHDIVMNAFAWIPGVYHSGLAHTRRLRELDPENLGNLEMLLFYHHCPDAGVQDDEAESVAHELLALSPQNPCALRALEEVAINRQRVAAGKPRLKSVSIMGSRDESESSANEPEDKGWQHVVQNPRDWSQVQQVMAATIVQGHDVRFNDRTVKVLAVNDHHVQVHYNLIDQQYGTIVTAWVK